MAERGTKRGPKVPDKAKPVVDKRRRSITNEMMRERQVFYFTFFFLKVHILENICIK